MVIFHSYVNVCQRLSIVEAVRNRDSNLLTNKMEAPLDSMCCFGSNIDMPYPGGGVGPRIASQSPASNTFVSTCQSCYIVRSLVYSCACYVDLPFGRRFLCTCRPALYPTLMLLLACTVCYHCHVSWMNRKIMKRPAESFAKIQLYNNDCITVI